MLIGQAAYLGKEFGAEVVVAALALDGFDDQCGNVAGMLANGCLYLCNGQFFSPFYFRQNLIGHREAQLGIDHPRPVELGKIQIFTGILCVGQGKRITRAPVKRILEMDHLCAKSFDAVR